MIHKSYFNWSGGKDSALALYYAIKDNYYEISRLVTCISSQFRRVSMHGVREELLEVQAHSINLPLQKLILPDQPSMIEYNKFMMNELSKIEKEGYTYSFFGDIFLEDLKVYREQQLAGVGLKGVFPLWKMNTKDLIYEFIELGFKSIVVCTNAALLDESFAGRIIDKSFVEDLPPGVDPCGENGEFHSFVFDGPIFSREVKFKIGEKVLKNYHAPNNEKDDCFAPVSKASSIEFCFIDLVIQ